MFRDDEGRVQRVGAYGVCLDADRRILLCRLTAITSRPGWWTLPGGGVDFGEGLIWFDASLFDSHLLVFTLTGDMALRIGVHLGPVYTARDPVLRHDNFFGAHVSRAARIEPVTPENCVYVTETMAAVLALHNSDAFTCEYVGMTEAAKHYGQMRMFLLARRGS